MKYFKLMRVHHWIKNLLVFLPVIFNKSFFERNLLGSSCLGFLTFSLMSSAIYIFNDLVDLEKDRQHPTKCKRPIASGSVTKQCAGILFGLLVAATVILGLWSGGWQFLVIYFLTNLAYSIKLKNYPIIDIMILASGFLLRLLYGSAITGIQVSDWLYLTVIVFAFYFGLGKRRNELKKTGASKTRKVLQYYNQSFCDKNMYMCISLGIAFYSLWTIENNNPLLIWSVPIVMIICMKYSLDIEGDSEGDPVEVLVHDKLLLAMCAGYAAIIMLMLYI